MTACIFCRGREGDSLNHHLIATRYDLERATVERDELQSMLDGCLVHGCHTEESRALGDVLGLREGKHTAASTCAMAKEEIERLRRERDEANDAWAAAMAMSAMATTESGFPTITVGRHSLYALHRMCDRAEAERNAAQAELADVRAELAKVKGART